MKLKHQLLLLALLSVLFPVTAWFTFKSVDEEFRVSIEQAAKNTLISLKSSVQELLENDGDIVLHGFVPELIEEYEVDGDSDEWNGISPYVFVNDDQRLSLKLALKDKRLVIFIESNDASINAQSPGTNANDHIIVAVANDRGLYQYHLNRQAEGMLLPSDDSQNKPSFQAYWHERAQGYTIEMVFNSSNFHHLGLAMIDAHQVGKFTGTLQVNSSETIQLQPMVIKNHMFEKVIGNITPPNHHFIIQDSQQRVIYNSDKLPSEQNASAWQWIITPIYQWLFAVDTTDLQWFHRQDGMSGVQHEIIDNDIHFVLKSMLPKGQQNMIQTLLKASVMMISVVIFLMLAYLLYAFYLAWRVRKLNNAMHTVLDDSGHLTIDMPSRLAADEIGQLARGIESMLTEMSEYTQYLKDLGARLSHEMKTPLAIVQSSLDNLAYENDDEFLQRAQQGTKRLRFILNQLSELSRLKYALQQTPKQALDVNDLVTQLGASYQTFIPQLQVEVAEHPMMINGSNDLLAQLIDKLIENAKSFTPENGVILISVTKQHNKAQLSVFNSGSQLPEDHKDNIFDSLVSLRSKKTVETTHLGLGLYLVRLISRYHDASVVAENKPVQKGVIFTVTFNVI